jgi:Holliday junction resolvase
MSNPQKAKGSSAERDVVNWLKINGFPYAERRIAGAHLDKGDIAGVNGVVIEVKNHKRIDLSAWVKELEVEIKNDKAWTGAVIHKRERKGDVGEWYVTMPAKIWIELIRKILDDK